MMNCVTVNDEVRLFDAYEAPAAEELPMFAENRVHQRSSGNPYPNKVVMQVDRAHRSAKPFRVITLENEFIRVEILPEIGGRIYSAYDKRTGYDFFYKQHVIKPALIGLLGSWISGGCEFNWPCHHRPSTYMPVDVEIERHENGAVTVWLSENEPLDRMKGMVGIYMAPGEARFDTRMKVYNRTAKRHSFLWWENTAVPVNEQYRLVFPPDVHYVQFHYRKSVTSYPVASGVYNGIRLGENNDISYHKNTRQPTSYFCAESKYDFFGGYDEGKRCGVVHVADHTVSVGKKMFTWAYNQLSHSWEKALTDTDGAYAELMASSYSLNQPDFTWLMPYECKEFSQMWYPVGDIGTPMCACAEAAFAVEGHTLKVQPTIAMKGAVLNVNGEEHVLDLNPEKLEAIGFEGELESFILATAAGRELLCYEKPCKREVKPMPETIPDNPTIDKFTTAQELYLMGVHVDQYRDPVTQPDVYLRAAIARDPEYVPALTMLAEYELDHLRVEEAYSLAKRAWKKVTMRNYHPESGNLQYVMGRILERMDKESEAWEWYMQAAWAQDTRSRALTRAAMIDGRRGRWTSMADLAEKALGEHAGNETALALLAIAQKHVLPEAVEETLRQLKHRDALNLVGRALEMGAVPEFYDGIGTNAQQTVLDVASELAEAGEKALAAQLLLNLPEPCAQTVYVYAWMTENKALLAEASKLGAGIAYPCRECEYDALKWAVAEDGGDANAMNLLACLEYARGNHETATALWEKAIESMPGCYMYYRNLAVAYYSHMGKRKEALALLDKALERQPHDGQLVWEKAQLMLRLHCNPEDVIAFLTEENNPREDIRIELCRAYNMAGQYENALKEMLAKSFTPCEGGEHAVAEQYMLALHALGRIAYKEGRIEDALKCFRKAQQLPESLGAGLWSERVLVPQQYYEALCLEKLGDQAAADALFDHIMILQQDYFTGMYMPELTCWQAMVYRHRGLIAPAMALEAAHLHRQEAAEAAVDTGYYKTTPFFISYMETPSALRTAVCSWQKAMICFASGDIRKAKAFAQKSLEIDPTNLYAQVLVKE